MSDDFHRVSTKGTNTPKYKEQFVLLAHSCYVTNGWSHSLFAVVMLLLLLLIMHSTHSHTSIYKLRVNGSKHTQCKKKWVVCVSVHFSRSLETILTSSFFRSIKLNLLSSTRINDRTKKKENYRRKKKPDR